LIVLDVEPLEIDSMREGHGYAAKLAPRAVFLIIASFALALGPITVQALEANAIEGHWQVPDGLSVLDITRCGEDYCGQHVKSQDKENACDRTILKIKPALSDARSPTFEGILDLDDGAGPYPVSVRLSDDGETLTILGYKEKSPIWSRVIPLRIPLARRGNAACFPPPTR
jgi:hypothetical protein